jgi:hypothetical protein
VSELSEKDYDQFKVTFFIFLPEYIMLFKAGKGRHIGNDSPVFKINTQSAGKR